MVKHSAEKPQCGNVALSEQLACRSVGAAGLSIRWSNWSDSWENCPVDQMELTGGTAWATNWFAGSQCSSFAAGAIR